MKIAAITDTHFRGKVEVRKDDYLQSILSNLYYVLSTCIEQEIKLLVHSGDFGDVYNWGQSAPSAFVEVIKALSEFKKHGITILVVPGQHDMQNHNIDSWASHSLGALHYAGLINVLDEFASYRYAGDDGDDIVVYGFPYGSSKTEDFLKGVWRPTHLNKSLTSIALVHASIGGEETDYCYSIKKQNVAGVDFACFGDIHDGFAPYKANSGTICFNVGPLDYRSVREIEKPRQFAIIDTKLATVKFFEIPTKPVEAMFDLNDKSEELASKAELELRAAEFAAFTRKEIQHLTPAEIVKRAGAKMELDEEIILEVISRL